jgi:tetratricopeptide (TPR) repeat protein
MSWWQRLLRKTRGTAGAAGSQGPGACDHGAIALRQGTADFEWFVARGELEMGRNLEHGASHLANLLTYDPGNPEWVELLERYLAAAGPDPESLIPRGDKLYFGTEAVRAYIWQKQERLADAIQLLVDATAAKPDARYLEAWGLGWLEPPGAVESLPPPLGLRVFSTALGRLPEARQSPAPKLRQAQRWARLCERFVRVHPGDGVTLMLKAGLLRKAGRYDDAESAVRPAVDGAPDWHTSTALGLILREKGDPDGAADAFRLALDLDPADLSARLEAGDTYLEVGRWQAALEWYTEVLAKDSRHAWAHPSAVLCRWKLTDEESHLRALKQLAQQGNARAQELGYRTFSAAPREPADATANVLRQIRQMILEKPAESAGGEVKITVSNLEAPSNLLAFRLEMAALRHDIRLVWVVDRVPTPDPRRAIGEVKYTLWRYEGTDPAPGLPAPSDAVVGSIAELASGPYEERVHWARASRVAEELGAARVGEILAAMVHPPAVPAGTHALAWLPRVQRAAVEVAAQVDEGWVGSARRDALLSVLLGPRDWATGEAIRVLSRLGCENEAIAPDIHDAFQALADHRPDRGYWPWEVALYRRWLELPHLFPDEREGLKRTLDALEAEQRYAANG